MYFSYTKAIQQKGFQASDSHQGHLEGGELNSDMNQINTLQMVKNTHAGLNWLVVEDAVQSGEYSKRQLVRSGMSQMMVKLPCVSVSRRRTFLICFDRGTFKLTQVVVLPTPPFWLTMAMIWAFIFSWLLSGPFLKAWTQGHIL